MSITYRYFKKSDGTAVKFSLHNYDDEYLDTWMSDNSATEISESDYESILNPFDLETAQTEQIDALREKCESEIIDDFSSDATGTTLYYCAQERDQGKFARLAQNDENGQIYCSTTNPEDPDADGAYEFVEHTASQIKQVLKDFNSHEQEVIQHFVTLRNEILAIVQSDYESDDDCQTAIEAITWDSYTASEE